MQMSGISIVLISVELSCFILVWHNSIFRTSEKEGIWPYMILYKLCHLNRGSLRRHVTWTWEEGSQNITSHEPWKRDPRTSRHMNLGRGIPEHHVTWTWEEGSQNITSHESEQRDPRTSRHMNLGRGIPEHHVTWIWTEGSQNITSHESEQRDPEHHVTWIWTEGSQNIASHESEQRDPRTSRHMNLNRGFQEHHVT